MKIVNPLGRVIEKLDSKANYISPLAGCVCSGPAGTAASYNKGPGYCVGYCDSGATNRTANKDKAKVQ